MNMDVLQFMEDVMMETHPDRPLVHAPRRSRCRCERLQAMAQEQLALLASISTLGFWRWNRAADRVWASKGTRSILELGANTSLSRDTMLVAIHPVDRAAMVRAISASAQHGDMVEMEVRVVKKDREIRWITAKTCAYRDGNGMLLKLAGYVLDDSRCKRVEAESLEQKRRITHLTRVTMLGGLSGALAHELQQPLTSILCNAQAAQLLAGEASVNIENLQEILRDIISEDKRAGQIIQHLSSLLMRGEQHVQLLAISDLVRHALTLTRSTLIERAVQVDLRIDESVSAAAMGNPVELQQVLLNLILNACDAMRDNPAGDRRIEITVALDGEQGEVRTSVRDCGKGIDRNQLDQIFDPFFTTKSSGLGMGLGLAVSRSIMAAHDGELWATNNSDRGATFHFTLPTASTRDSNEQHRANSICSG